MSITLEKGGNLSLTKEDPGMSQALIGLGWDSRETEGVDFDLDASLFMCGPDGKVRSEKDFIFYNQMTSACGSVQHTGDNRTGDGDGDDEALKVALSQVPADVERLVVTVTIHEAEARNQNFGMVRNAFIRIVNDETRKEVVRYDLSEDYSTETAMVFGELYRHNGEWKFRAVGQGYAGGLRALAHQHGINI